MGDRLLPGGRALVTERPGRVRLLGRDGRLRRAPVARVPVTAQGEGGLLGLAVDPRFAANRRVYLYFTTASGMRLERRRFTGSRLVREGDARRRDPRRARSTTPAVSASAPTARLYVSTGDAGDGRLAQDPASLNGKLLALTPREYHGSATVRPAVVATGLRNTQGFDWQPGSGPIDRHGARPDGVRRPRGLRRDQRAHTRSPTTAGRRSTVPTPGAGCFTPPLHVYRDAIAPSGATFVTRRGSRWTGDFLFAALRGEQLRRLVLRGGRVVRDQPLLTSRFGRLRTGGGGPARGALRAHQQP